MVSGAKGANSETHVISWHAATAHGVCGCKIESGPTDGSLPDSRPEWIALVAKSVYRRTTSGTERYSGRTARVHGQLVSSEATTESHPRSWTAQIGIHPMDAGNTDRTWRGSAAFRFGQIPATNSTHAASLEWAIPFFPGRAVSVTRAASVVICWKR
jgi:hypothetical protein